MKSYPIIKYPNYLCVPASVKSVIERRKLGKFDLIQLGIEFGLEVPSSKSKDYPGVPINTNNQFKITLKGDHSLNSFFRNHKLQLKEKYYYRIKPDQIYKILSENKNNDILVCFDFPSLNHVHGKWGHVSLVTGFNKKEVFIQDPGSSKSQNVIISNLINSIKIHGRKKKAGFWVIE